MPEGAGEASASPSAQGEAAPEAYSLSSFTRPLSRTSDPESVGVTKAGGQADRGTGLKPSDLALGGVESMMHGHPSLINLEHDSDPDA